MNIKPLGDKVVLEPVTEDVKTKSGIVLPDTHEKEKPEKGKVVAVGPGHFNANDTKRVPVGVKKGDIVLFKKYSADEFKIGGKEFLVVGAEEIIGIVTK